MNITNKLSLREKIKKLREKDLINIFHHFYDVNGEEALWRAVITQALMDASSESRKKTDRCHKARAIAWLAGRSKDFADVCSMAGFDRDFVIANARLALKRNCYWRKPPSLNKKEISNKSGNISNFEATNIQIKKTANSSS